MMTPAQAQRQRLGETFYSKAPCALRPPAPEIKPVKFGEPKPLISPGLEKYARQQERNQLLNACCRHPENMTAQMFKTHPDLSGPDKLIATCDICGRKHHTMKVGQGQKPDEEWKK